MMCGTREYSGVLGSTARPLGTGRSARRCGLSADGTAPREYAHMHAMCRVDRLQRRTSPIPASAEPGFLALRHAPRCNMRGRSPCAAAAIVGYFDIEFSSLHKPITFSTGPGESHRTLPTATPPPPPPLSPLCPAAAGDVASQQSGAMAVQRRCNGGATALQQALQQAAG